MNCALVHLFGAFFITAALYGAISHFGRKPIHPPALLVIIVLQTIPLYLLLRVLLRNQPCDLLLPSFALAG